MPKIQFYILPTIDILYLSRIRKELRKHLSKTRRESHHYLKVDYQTSNDCQIIAEFTMKEPEDQWKRNMILLARRDSKKFDFSW